MVARWELGTFSSDGIDGIEVVKKTEKKKCKDAVEKQCDGPGPVRRSQKSRRPQLLYEREKGDRLVG